MVIASVCGGSFFSFFFFFEKETSLFYNNETKLKVHENYKMS